jgi:hypothetical protein
MKNAFVLNTSGGNRSVVISQLLAKIYESLLVWGNPTLMANFLL